MGLFTRKKKEEKEETFRWKVLDKQEDFKTIDEESKTKPVLLFKHSTRCGISSGVLNRFKKEYEDLSQEASIYYLDLLNHRDLSNEIASRYQVMHQSPQLVVVKEGKAISHASHYDILELDITSLY